MSKSQLQRINAIEKLTDKVKAAIDDKSISESAALAMSNMTAEEQDACLEKITSGKIKGTIQDIQNFSSSKVVEKVEASMPDKSEDESSLENIPAGTIMIKLADVPEEFDDPQKEASDWIYQEQLAIYEMIYKEALRLSEEENALIAAQWRQRAVTVRHNIEELKLSALFREQIL